MTGVSLFHAALHPRCGRKYLLQVVLLSYVSIATEQRHVSYAIDLTGVICKSVVYQIKGLRDDVTIEEHLSSGGLL